jgi:hypothetical protein
MSRLTALPRGSSVNAFYYGIGKCGSLFNVDKLRFVSIFTINTGKSLYHKKFTSRSFMNGFRRV